MSTSGRITISPAPTETLARPKRRRHSVAEKRHIVEESFKPGASVARVARAHEVNANQVFKWRRQYQRGLLGGNGASISSTLLPVTVSDLPPIPDPAPVPAPSVPPTGTMQLQLARGRLRIEGVVDPASLRIVLECLLG